MKTTSITIIGLATAFGFMAVCLRMEVRQPDVYSACSVWGITDEPKDIQSAIIFRCPNGSTIEAQPATARGGAYTPQGKAVSEILLGPPFSDALAHGTLKIGVGPDLCQSNVNSECMKTIQIASNELPDGWSHGVRVSLTPPGSHFSSYAEKAINYRGDKWLITKASLLFGAIASGVSLTLRLLTTNSSNPTTQRFFANLAIGAIPSFQIAGLMLMRGAVFQTNDDPTLRSILNGTMGSGEPFGYNAWQCAPWTELIACLYRYHARFDWYSAGLLTASVASNAAIYATLAGLRDPLLRSVAYAIILLIFFPYTVSEYQFTSVSFFAAGAGLLLACCANCGSGGKNPIFGNLGWAFIVASATIRIESAVCAMILFSTFVLPAELATGGFPNASKSLMAKMLRPFLIVLGVYIYSNASHSSAGMKLPATEDLVFLRDKALHLNTFLPELMDRLSFTDYQKEMYFSWGLIDPGRVGEQCFSKLAAEKRRLLTPESIFAQAIASLLTYRRSFIARLTILTAVFFFYCSILHSIRRRILISLVIQIISLLLWTTFFDVWLKAPARILFGIAIIYLLSVTYSANLFLKDRPQILKPGIFGNTSLAGTLCTIPLLYFSSLCSTPKMETRIRAESVSCMLSVVATNRSINRVMYVDQDIASTGPFSRNFGGDLKLVPFTAFATTPLFRKSSGTEVDRAYKAFLRDSDPVWLVGAVQHRKLIRDFLALTSRQDVQEAEEIDVGWGFSVVRFEVLQN